MPGGFEGWKLYGALDRGGQKPRIDLKMQEALASQRDEVIAELKDEAFSQWASGWLAFQRRWYEEF